MSDLAEFLKARLDEDEAVARAAGGLAWSTLEHPIWEGRIEDSRGEVIVYDEGAPTAVQAAHIARHDPARVLADVAAKRKIVALARREEYLSGGLSGIHAALLLALAQPYADHADFDEEWRA